MYSMPVKDAELWHLVEAKGEDDRPTMFRIRELVPKMFLPDIFVAELPYASVELSRLPDAAAYRRLAEFEENWLRPACVALGWTFVATKIADGAAFFYAYGSGDSTPLVEKLSPFDGGLAFYDEHDEEWSEYSAIRELLDEANALKDTVSAAPAPRRPAAKPTKAAPARARASAKKKPK